jgi:hypothetical protein
MAAQAKRPANESPPGRIRAANGQLQSPEVVIKVEDVRDVAARMYGLGFKRPQIASSMAHVLTPDGNVKTARRKLGRWEQEQEFRDQIWQYAVVKMDLELPEILKGVTKAAKRGRVDAAKLALSVTERHTDKSEMPTEVTIRLAGTMPRPELKGPEDLPPKALPVSTTDEDLG